ncbi:hypothetical protein N0V90_007896 [Kalmusia sp. IMI 367209]|nr:hypothetical protein N0V90_007896 [Kalmusia sp. IMI 367209]
MSDEVAKPGAPSPHAADKAAEFKKSVSVPSNAVSAVKQVDRLILRLNKLIATPGGLSAFLSTSNYVLYILAYLQPKTPSLASIYARLLALLKLSSKAPTVVLASNTAAVPPFAALAQLLSKCRTTLRLFGTLPLYAWLRTLLAGPKPGADLVLHRIALLQASSYFTYQLLENICVLADHTVIPSSFIARLNRGTPTTARLYTIAYRSWLAGVSCDFLRLAREAQNISRKRAARSDDERVEAKEEDERVDKRWWMDLAIAGAWFPMALHFSSLTGGVPGWHMGWMGVCGLVAGGERMRGLWRATGP